MLELVASQSGLAPAARNTFDEPPDYSAAEPPRDDERSRIVEALGPTPVPVDEIVHHTGLHPAQVYLVLLELDLAGRLERHSGGWVSLVAPDR